MSALSKALSPITLSLDQLLLDPNNPRFSELGEDLNPIPEARFAEEKVQQLTKEKMKAAKFDVAELRDTIKTVGFLQMDRIVVRKWQAPPGVSSDKYVVVEGNRRATALTYEIASDERYIRRINESHVALAKRLQGMDPFRFEELCRAILDAFGALAENTKKTYDGGVDFFALNMRTYSGGLPLPVAAALTVVGQAKRYAAENEVSETELRKFVGGAMLKLHELRADGRASVLGPVVFAFWTTSQLHMHAKGYATRMGMWHMDGLALAEYVQKLGLAKSFPELVAANAPIAAGRE